MASRNKALLVVATCAFWFVQCCESASARDAVSNEKNSAASASLLKDSSYQAKKNTSDPRTFKHGGKLLVPVLIGGLLKVAATIPLLLAAASIIGAISLITSKVSLLISGILGIRTLLSLLPSPEPKEPPPPPPPTVNPEDWKDLQTLIAKNSQSAYDPQNSLPNAYKMQELMRVAKQQKANMEMMYLNDMYQQQLDQGNIYYPENYFQPSSPGLEPINGNQIPMEEYTKVAGAHAITRMQNRVDARKTMHANRNLAMKDMALRANAILDRQAIENPNNVAAVKITKTVVKTGL